MSKEIGFSLPGFVSEIKKIKGVHILNNRFVNLNGLRIGGLEYFVEIGKFRAFNNLLSEVANKYGVTEFSNTLTAKTSIWSKSITDAETNLLRT